MDSYTNIKTSPVYTTLGTTDFIQINNVIRCTFGGKNYIGVFKKDNRTITQNVYINFYQENVTITPKTASVSLESLESMILLNTYADSTKFYSVKNFNNNKSIPGNNRMIFTIIAPSIDIDYDYNLFLPKLT